MVEAFHPGTLAEALEIRASRGAVLLAGGTDLLVKLSRGAGRLPGFTAPVVFLDRCAELAGLELRGGSLEAGAMTTLAALADSPLVHPVLRDILLSMGGPAIRNAATLGGNLCNASPAGDTLPFLYAFDASVKLASPRGERTLPVCGFVTGPGRTLLAADEIVRSIIIPAWQPRVAYWRKVGTRRANALTKVSLAGFAEAQPGRLGRVRVAVGAVAPTVLRLRDVEALLEQARPGASRAELLAGVSAAALACVTPIDDQRSTAAYRREVAANMTREFARQALDEAFGREG